ncbi:lasso peptide biosynthesis B2 protein [Halorubrum tibetense]|uniref:Lasso peptide biosynthesis B2 protein n=1 Tax=Halorubrum tibetense TaxID=175631 RepID=A0ABD5S9H0_9EURY
MLSALRKIASLSREERQLLATTTVSLVASRSLLTIVGLDPTHRALDLLVRALPPYRRVRDPRRVPWAVNTVDTALPIYFSCLMRAVVGERLFDANGYRTEIRLGVAKDEAFEAHAWVIHEGEVVIGEVDDHARFRLLDSYCPK